MHVSRKKSKKKLKSTHADPLRRKNKTAAHGAIGVWLYGYNNARPGRALHSLNATPRKRNFAHGDFGASTQKNVEKNRFRVNLRAKKLFSRVFAQRVSTRMGSRNYTRDIRE